ncbi:hypothetical protein KCU71_g3389, partial [Aureobasidium melanogenum]
MKKRQKNPSKGPIMPPCKPVDFTARSGNGLGDLGRFPREIRNMIYSSLVPQVMPHAFEHKIIDRFAVRKLVNAPILATSKQLCVEFLEVFMREVHLEEDDGHDVNPRLPSCLERLLTFVETRIDFAFSTKRVGLAINTGYLGPHMMKYMEECSECHVDELPQRLQRLWDIHETYRIPSDQFYIDIDYYEPGCWIVARLTAYKAVKLREFRDIYDSEEDFLVMDKVLNSTLTRVYRDRPVPGLFDFHFDMGKTAINFWKAKEEQYSVWHHFDLAESWLEMKNE